MQGLMVRFITFHLILVVIFAQNSFSESKFLDSQFQDYIVAKVNNSAITNSELQDRIKIFKILSNFKSDIKSKKSIFESAILDKMIEGLLIKQDAKKSEIELTESEIANGLEIVALSQGFNLSKVKKILKKNNLDFEVFVDRVKTEILWSKIIAIKIRSQIAVSQSEIEQTLKQNNLIKKEKSFRIAEILINKSKNDQAISKKIYEELNNGADFDEMARNFSQSYNFDNGAEIGWVGKSQINQLIYDIILNLKVGQYSKPHKIGANYRIFKLLDVKLSEDVDPNDIDKVENYLRENKIRIKSKSYLMELKKNSFIEIVDR